MSLRAKWIMAATLFLSAATLISMSLFLPTQRSWLWISTALTVLALLPFFLSFERKKLSSVRLMLLAALTALSVVGRIVFTAIPFFKPVAAIVILSGVCMGAESGFLAGSLSAFISNLYFGQGIWTPYQMLGWGVIGLTAGLLAKPLKKSMTALLIYGAAAGIFFSLWMDLLTVLLAEDGFGLARFGALIVTALPVIAVYAASDVVFLLLLKRPIMEKLNRILEKYKV